MPLLRAAHCDASSESTCQFETIVTSAAAANYVSEVPALRPQFEVCQGDNCYFTLQSLIILCPSYLLFMVMNGGLSTPGGLFMPSIMVGPRLSSPCILSLWCEAKI